MLNRLSSSKLIFIDQYIASATNLLIVLLTARIFGSSVLGQISIFIFYASLTNSVVENIVDHSLVLTKGSPLVSTRILDRLVCCLIFNLVACTIVYFLASSFVPSLSSLSNNAIIIGTFYIPAYCLTEHWRRTYLYLKQLPIIVVFSVFRLSFIVTIFTTLYFLLPYNSDLDSFFFGMCILIVPGLVAIYIQFKELLFNSNVLKLNLSINDFMKNGPFLTANVLSDLLISSTIGNLLTIQLSAVLYGTFRFYQALFGVFNPLFQYLFYSSLIGIRKHSRNSILIFSCVLFLVYLSCLPFAPQIITLFSGSEIVFSYPLYFLFILAFIFLPAVNMKSGSLLRSAEFTRIFRSSILTFVSIFILILLLRPYFGTFPLLTIAIWSIIPLLRFVYLSYSRSDFI